MSRNTGSTWKKSRRLDFSILETGQELTRRNYAPGQHGNGRRPKLTTVYNYKKNNVFVIRTN